MQFRDVKRPAQLKSRPASDEEVARLKAGTMTAHGTDLSPDQGATQLDCFYLDNKTLVVPLNGPADLKPWIIDGHIRTHHCIAHYKASLAGAEKTEGSK